MEYIIKMINECLRSFKLWLCSIKIEFYKIFYTYMLEIQKCIEWSVDFAVCCFFKTMSFYMKLFFTCVLFILNCLIKFIIYVYNTLLKISIYTENKYNNIVVKINNFKEFDIKNIFYINRSDFYMIDIIKYQIKKLFTTDYTINCTNNLIMQIYKTYYIFINLDYKILFCIILLSITYSMVKYKNIISLFFNSICILIVISMFLFVYNSGAFVGFLFLCEIVSLFVLFIIFNKINFVVYNKKQQNFYLYLFVFFTIVVFLNIKFFKIKNYILYDNFYLKQICNPNDFFAITSLIYTNYYNIFNLIVFMLIVLTIFIIHIINTQKISNNFFLKKNLNNCLYETYNNLRYFKNIFLKYFKKNV